MNIETNNAEAAEVQAPEQGGADNASIEAELNDHLAFLSGESDVDPNDAHSFGKKEEEPEGEGEEAKEEAADGEKEPEEEKKVEEEKEEEPEEETYKLDDEIEVDGIKSTVEELIVKGAAIERLSKDLERREARIANAERQYNEARERIDATIKQVSEKASEAYELQYLIEHVGGFREAINRAVEELGIEDSQFAATSTHYQNSRETRALRDENERLRKQIEEVNLTGKQIRQADEHAATVKQWHQERFGRPLTQDEAVEVFDRMERDGVSFIQAYKDSLIDWLDPKEVERRAQTRRLRKVERGMESDIGPNESPRPARTAPARQSKKVGGVTDEEFAAATATLARRFG